MRASSADLIRLTLIAALLLVAGCASQDRSLSLGGGSIPPPPPPPPPPLAGRVLPDWRSVIRPEDLDKLGRLDFTWRQALQRIMRSGAPARLGNLLRPGIEFGGALPVPGAYGCRTITLRPKGTAAHDLSVGGWSRCAIEPTANGLKFIMGPRASRLSGLLYPDTDTRMVLLASEGPIVGRTAYVYGHKPERDLVGVVERLTGQGWRIVCLWPHSEAVLRIIELRAAS